MIDVRLAAGDTNMSLADRIAFAKAAGATLVEGHGVDALFVRGAKPILSKVLAKGGSDHPPVVHWLRAPLRSDGWVHDGHDLVVLQWNVYVGQPPLRVKLRLRRLLRKYRPDVVMLCEAYRCGPGIAALADRLGYAHVQGPNVGEEADCALLLSLRHKVRRTGFARMRQPWKGLAKHGRPSREPRVYPRGRTLLAPRVVLRGMSLHFPTDGPGNEQARDESKRRAAAWLRR